MERVRRIELRSKGWKPSALPLSYTRFILGAGDKIRTRDLLITNQLLYQLSYAGFSYRPFRSTQLCCRNHHNTNF